MMTSKFKIGDRVTVAPMDEDEEQAGAMNGAVTKVWPVDDDGIYYMVELDEPLSSMIDEGVEPPYRVDAAEWELTSLDKPYKVW